MTRIALAIALMLPLAACGGGGASTTTQVQNTTVSKGQQLIDLKRALDSGAMSAREYETQRDRVLAAP